MQPNKDFLYLPSEFWANIKLINQKTNYSKGGKVIIPDPKKVQRVYKKLGISDKILFSGGSLTEFGEKVYSYFEYRANVLNGYVEKQFMNVKEAKKLYKELLEQYEPTCPLPDNKQKKEKAGKAYFTCCINILVQASLGGIDCCYDPKQITSFTHGGFPSLSLSRRLDGSFPYEVDPIAVWEIKEYYYTTTFGSRIADGVYETMLDGYELVNARGLKKRPIKHYLFTDAYDCWWKSGKSYLCRIVDILHMGLLDEWIVGKEILTRVPQIVQEWTIIHDSHNEFKKKPTQVTLSLS